MRKLFLNKNKLKCKRFLSFQDRKKLWDPRVFVPNACSYRKKTWLTDLNNRPLLDLQLRQGSIMPFTKDSAAEGAERGWAWNKKLSDEELKLLEKEAKRLQNKLEKHKEIRRLQLELQQTSISFHPLDDDNDEDYYYENNHSTESVYSRPSARWQKKASSSGTSQRTESSEFVTPEEFA